MYSEMQLKVAELLELLTVSKLREFNCIRNNTNNDHDHSITKQPKPDNNQEPDNNQNPQGGLNKSQSGSSANSNDKNARNTDNQTETQFNAQN